MARPLFKLAFCWAKLGTGRPHPFHVLALAGLKDINTYLKTDSFGSSDAQEFQTIVGAGVPR